jgi:hypothetical protein
VPKVELPSGKPSIPPGGPLALSATSVRPADTNSIAAGSAPPFAASSSAPPIGTSSPAARGLTPATPYASSIPVASSNPASGPTATLSAPTSPEAVSAFSSGISAPPADAVCNLSPPPDFAPPAAATPSSTNPTESLLQSKFAALMTDVQKALDEGRFSEAHLALSHLYGKPDLPAELAKQVTALLDQLAGTVIYSRQYYLEPPYVTQQGETIETVAQKYNVPWELLARINGLIPPAAVTDSAVKDRPLPARMELKVVRGPFDAVVNLDRHELTLMLQGRYAGRFPIAVGRDQPTLEGSYTVREKAVNPTYYGPDGTTINPNDPRNPLGHAWIGLTDRIGIHGVNNPQAIGRSDNQGAIGVGDRDLQDLYGILSVGSRVTVMR